MIRQPGDSMKKRDYFRMCQVNQQCRTTMCPKGVARGNQHCPEKQMAMYVTASLPFYANKGSWSEVQPNPPNTTAFQAMVPSGASLSHLFVLFFFTTVLKYGLLCPLPNCSLYCADCILVLVLFPFYFHILHAHTVA